MSFSRNSGKRPAYVDLDAPEEAVQQTSTTPSQTGSNPSSSSSGKKGRKRASERDADYPPITYTNFIREKALEFYRIRTRDMLERTYFTGDVHGVGKLQDELYRYFSRALEGHEVYNDCNSTYFHYNNWLEQQITTNTTNIVQTFECVHKKPKDGEYSEEQKELLMKLRYVQQQCGKFSTNKRRVRPWHEAALKSAMEKYMWGTVQGVPKGTKIVPLSGDQEGGFGKVRKVRIVGMVTIPETLVFAGKMSKAVDETKKRHEASIEAMVCRIQHPGVIKFFAVHDWTMEAYTLWWNGDCIQNFLHRENALVSEGIANSNILKPPVNLPIATLQRVQTFRNNRAKLAWALICIMDRVHKGHLMHNDISPGNVLLHFPEDKVDQVYIGVCDWGLASRVCETTPSNYGFPNQQDLEASHKHRGWFVAPELWYTYGKPNSETPLESQQRRHLYSQAADAYSVGVIANHIWNNEDDRDLFKDNVGKSRFAVALKELMAKDPKSRSTLAKAVGDLTIAPYNFQIPDCCFRNEI